MKTMRIVLAVFFLLSVCAPAFAIHETQPAETQAPLPGADAVKLYEYLAKQKPYTSWELWPGKGKMYKGSQPHGEFLTTYVNDAALFGIKGRKGSMPESALIVKENYGADKKLIALSVMYKVRGYNPAAADWFWAKYDGSGKVLASGKAEACIACHGKKKDNDYLFSGEMK